MINFRTLKADEIEVRISKITSNGAFALLYKTARADMNLLDETVGPENWYNDYNSIKDNLFCTLYVRESEDKSFIGKQDCGIESKEDGGNEKKGEASDAFKRAGFRWGIGRELYTAPVIKIDLPRDQDERGRWKLKRNVYLSVSEIEYDDQRRIRKLVITNSGETVFVFPASAIPDDDLDEIEQQRSTDENHYRTIILGLAHGDVSRIDAYVGQKWPGSTFQSLTLEQLREAYVNIAKKVQHESERA